MKYQHLESVATKLGISTNVSPPIVVACLMVVLLSGSLARGQDNPFGDTATTTEPPAATTADGKKEKASNELSEYDKAVAAETDPLVRSILDAKPTTPDQWIHDARTLLHLHRPIFVKEYLKQFLASKPDEAKLAKIQARYGTAFFLQLTTASNLQPEGTAVAEAVTNAAQKQMEDSARLAALVDRLDDPDPATRRLALVDLVKAGSAAAVPLIKVLGDSKRSAKKAASRAALVALGDQAIDPLIATLSSSNMSLRAATIPILGDIEALRAVPFVLSSVWEPETEPQVSEAAREMLRKVLSDVPSRQDAIRFLSRRLDVYLAGSPPATVNQDDQVPVWIWDDAQSIPRQLVLPAADASFFAAASVAKELHRIDSTNHEFRRMYLATGLEVAKRRNGYNRPLTKEAGPIYDAVTKADPRLLEDVLQLALDKGMPGAAIAAIDRIGQTKDVALLKSDNGQPRLLAKSLRSPIPRVKFAAARAVMALDPTSPYPGSSYLPEVLGYFAASAGERRVLIGNPRADQARQTAGYFKVLGFEVDTQQSGRRLILQAFSNPDYVFVLIHDTIDGPRYREAIQTLRRDGRTADLPIGLVVREINQDAAARFAQRDPLTMTLAPAMSQADVTNDVRRLLAIAGRRQVLPDERMEHALFALDALAKLAADSDKYGFYDLLSLDRRMEHALMIPALATRAAKVLGLLGTPHAQQALVDFVNTLTQPVAARRAAAEAFRTAVSRRGLLLTRDQMLHQYDAYNDSEFLDRDTQKILASVLDTMEARSRTSSSTAEK